MNRKRYLAATLAGALVLGAIPSVLPMQASAAWIGEIESSVSFRTGPSTDDGRIRYLKAGEDVAILEQVNSYWYKVKDQNGKIGYVSANAKYMTVSGSPEAPAAPAPAPSNSGLIVASVSLREGPSTSTKRIRYAAKGETVAILGKPNSYWYQVRDKYDNIGYVSTNAQYITASYQPPAVPDKPAAPKENTGVIVSSVSLREGPSTSFDRIRYVSKGETVRILGMPSEYWYEVEDKHGNVGYISTNVKYITADYKPPVIAPEDVPAAIQRIIDAGMRYLGTPYEFGSSRWTTETFDCSDFVRTAYLEGAGITLPSDSRAQGDYIRNRGRTTTDWTKLKPGDIVFFMSYQGSKASDYAGIDKSKATITHDAIYLGNGQLLHTYSNESGGVRTDSMDGTAWEHRFLFGGSAL